MKLERLLITLIILLITPLSHAQVLNLTTAQFKAGDQNPSIAKANLKNVQLPHLWYRDEVDLNIRKQTNGWYYLTFTINQLPKQTMGLYIRKFNVNAEIFLNQRLIKDGGIHQDPMPHYWNTPLYITINPNQFKKGLNHLAIHLITDYDFGMLSEIKIQPNATLMPIYENRRFIQNQLSQLIFIFYLFMGSFIFLLWIKRKADTIFLYLSMAIFTWANSTTAYFVHVPWVSDHFYKWLIYSSVVWATSLMVIVMLTYLQMHTPKIKKWLLTYAALGTLIYAITPYPYLASVHANYILGSLLFAWFAIFVLIRHVLKNRTFTPFLILISYLSMQLSGIHDWASTTGKSDAFFVLQTQLTGFTSVIFLIIITLEISRLYIKALSQSENLNNELNLRILQKSQTLNKQYQALQQLQKEQAITQERQRIYEDLNEDVGAKILSLVYLSKKPQNKTLARSALQDLRDVVSHSSKTETTINNLIADWHAETNLRLESAAMDLTWLQDIDLENKPITASSALHLTRILRELISNEIKHSNHSSITINVHNKNNRLQITIEDFNLQTRDTSSFIGNGINNIKYRCTQINANIKWQAKNNGGCKITLLLTP